MPVVSTSVFPPVERVDLAPRWHTALLVALIVGVAVVGTILTKSGVPVATPTASPSLPMLYAPMVLVAWGLLFYVCRVGRPRNVFAHLVGERWTSWPRAAGDVALAIAAWLALFGCESAWATMVGMSAGAPVAQLLPTTLLDRGMWVAVAISVGLSEEVVYRGYFQSQLGAFTRRPNVAWALQAILFGLAHAEQGPATMARFAVYALGLGALARWRRSLIPGILAHAWTDVASVLFHAGA